MSFINAVLLFCRRHHIEARRGFRWQLEAYPTLFCALNTSIPRRSVLRRKKANGSIRSPEVRIGQSLGPQGPVFPGATQIHIARAARSLDTAAIDHFQASAQAIQPLTTLRQFISEMAAAAFHAIADWRQARVSIPGKLIISRSSATILSHKKNQ